MRFVYAPPSSRVVFEPGALRRVAQEVQALGRRALVLSTPGQGAVAEQVSQLLDDRSAGVFDRARMHVPTSTVAEAEVYARQVHADCTVAIGGGSTIGLAKALALRLELPCLAIPTTYAGSEMSPIWGLTEGGIKTTGRDFKVAPRVVLYDPELTSTLPIAVTVASGFNAIAHCVEALYSPDANPITSIMAEEGIRAIARALPVIAREPTNLAARSEALYGAWLGGSVLGSVGMSLHHKLCHTLGGTFNMPHAETHTAVLPHVVAYNTSAAPEAISRVARALGISDAAKGLFQLAQSLGAEMALARLGLPVTGIEHATELTTQNPYANPRPITADGIRSLLRHAYSGEQPVRS
jgi:maleylacetate reductase